MKFYFFILVVLLVFVLLETTSFAQPKIPDEVMNVANSEIGDFKDVLTSQKEVFGLTDQDNINNISVGTGYATYHVLVPALSKIDSGQKGPSIKEMFVQSSRYIFPIKVGNKCVGVAFVDRLNGKWSMVQVSSYTSFESDIETVKDQIIKETGDTSLYTDENVLLIYDDSFKLAGLSLKDVKGEYIIALRDNSFINLKKGEKKDLSEVSKSISRYYKENMKTSENIATGGGLIAMESGSVKNYFYPMVAIIVASLVLVGLYFRKRALQSTSIK